MFWDVRGIKAWPILPEFTASVVTVLVAGWVALSQGLMLMLMLLLLLGLVLATQEPEDEQSEDG